MKSSLFTTTLITAFLFTACSADTGDEPVEGKPQAESEVVAPLPTETAAERKDALEPSSDGYTMQARFYWLPETADMQPVEARFRMGAPTDENSYSTPVSAYDVLPSIYSDDFYQHTFFVQDGDSVTAAGYTSNPPVEGKVACLLVETEQRVIIDYQVSNPGEDSAYCYGYAPDVEHDYHPGTPPADFPTPF